MCLKNGSTFNGFSNNLFKNGSLKNNLYLMFIDMY